jgi:hypothetical protein
MQNTVAENMKKVFEQYLQNLEVPRTIQLILFKFFTRDCRGDTRTIDIKGDVHKFLKRKGFCGMMTNCSLFQFNIIISHQLTTKLL